MQYDIVRHGNEQEPIIIIDDFSSYFDKLVEGANHAQFKPAGAGYPGLRSPLNAQYLGEKSDILSDVVQNIFGFTRGIKCDSCDYSIVTTNPGNLDPSQRIPHYDGPEDKLLAMMHYTRGSESGGTAFYRHKATGFEAITPHRQSEYHAVLQAELKAMGEPDYAYIYGDSNRFEMIGEIESKPNRLILYRGRTLHSGCISKEANLSSDPNIGRLTINGFLSDN